MIKFLKYSLLISLSQHRSDPRITPLIVRRIATSGGFTICAPILGAFTICAPILQFFTRLGPPLKSPSDHAIDCKVGAPLKSAP